MKKSTSFHIDSLDKALELRSKIKFIDVEIKMLQDVAKTLVSEECELELLVKVKTKVNAPQTLNDHSYPAGVNQMIFFDYSEFIKAINNSIDPELIGGRLQPYPQTRVAGYKFSFDERSCLLMCHQILKLKYEFRDRLVCELSKMGVQIE